MDSVKYENAISEVLHYLKGIRQEDIEKIPKKIMNFLYNNSSSDYECDFDFNKPLKELELQEEAKGIIATICYNYWCETDEEKSNFLNRLNENERKYQEKLSEKYNIEEIFNNRKEKITQEIVKDQTALVPYRQNIFKQFFNKIKNLFNKKIK